MTNEPHTSPIETADPDWGRTALVAIVGTIVLAIVFVFVQGLYGRAERAERERKIVAEKPVEYRLLRAAQLTRLHATGWVDKKNGIVAIPIERAMELMAADPNPAAPVAAPPPAAVPVPEVKKP
jgi:hypothetical protein